MDKRTTNLEFNEKIQVFKNIIDYKITIDLSLYLIKP